MDQNSIKNRKQKIRFLYFVVVNVNRRNPSPFTTLCLLMMPWHLNMLFSFYSSLRWHPRSVLRPDEAFRGGGSTPDHQIPLFGRLRRQRLLQHRVCHLPLGVEACIPWNTIPTEGKSRVPAPHRVFHLQAGVQDQVSKTYFSYIQTVIVRC